MNALLSGGTNLIIFVAMLGLLVFVHEFGHFIVAKKLHIPVLEFGFGFPPRVKRFMKRGETEYTINAIPLGGFVRLMGEEDPKVPGGFASAKPSVRAPILLAGVAMNVVLAYVAFMISAFANPPYALVQTTRVAAVAPDSPAALAGLRIGDSIAAVNDQNIKDNYPALSQLLRENAGRVVSLTVLRNGRPLDPISVTPRIQPPAGEGPLGIALNAARGLRVTAVQPGSVADQAGIRPGDVLVFIVDPVRGRTLIDESDLTQFTLAHPGWKIEWRVQRDKTLGEPIVLQIPQNVNAANATLGVSLRTSLLDAPRQAAIELVNIMGAIPTLFGQMTRGALPNNAFVGFVGIYQATGEVAQAGGPIALIEFLGLLSLNLAIVNLLPFPALDGGRLVFVLIEWLRGGKKIDPQKEGLVHLVGIAVLISFMILITFFDVQRLLSGQSILPTP
ncbi:MAG: RIP metalloprotease RseP [Chloroflexi bacterium]|nr:RIP metalloprotease RseP [Chloroflexota bacterium]